MTRVRRRCSPYVGGCLAAAVGLVAALGAAATRPNPLQPESPQSPPPSVPWAARLAGLVPSKPEEYFNLAEEVASEADDRTGRELAQRLFVLAYELDTRRARDGSHAIARLGPSVCLALASMATTEGDRRWLRALARSMEGGGAVDGRSVPGAPADPPNMESASFNLASAMGLARAGDGRRADSYLERQAVQELLQRLDGPDGPPDAHDVIGWLKRAVRDWPACPQCRNQRVIPSGHKPGERVLCDTCRGNPGPALTDSQLVRVLRIEAMLLGGRHRSWSGQVIADGGAPLRDLDPAELAGTFGVDPSRPVWRDGAWIAAEAGGETAK